MATPEEDGRALTTGERAMLTQVYGYRIPFNKVLVFPRRWTWPFPTNRSMAPNGNMYMPGRNYASDFSAPTATLYHKGVFIHEGAHLYQWYVLGWVVWARGPFARNYDYRIIPGQPYEKYGLEQMGMIAEHYYVLKHGGRPADLPDKSYSAASYAKLLPAR